MAQTAAEDALAKRLCFEDVSMQSPALFHRFQAQRAREAPSVDGLRRVLGELAATREQYYGHALADAADAADGLSDAELKRLKYAVTNLKGGVLELGAHARFVAALNENTPLAAVLPGPEAEQLADDVKRQKAELDALRADVDAAVAAVAAELAAFEAEHARVAAHLDAVAPAAGRAPHGAPPSENGGGGADEDDDVERARAAVAAADAELRAAEAAAAAARAAAAEAERALAPEEASLAALAARERALVPTAAATSAPGGATSAPALALAAESAAQYNSELCALLRGLSGVELLVARADALRLRLAGHTLTLHLALHDAAAPALAAAELEPPTVPVADLVAHAGLRLDVAVREVQARLAVLGHV